VWSVIVIALVPENREEKLKIWQLTDRALAGQ